MAIELKSVDWGEALSVDVHQVLNSTKDVMDSAFGGDIDNDIWVYQNLSRGNPVALFERGPHGEYKIELNVTDRYWAKYAYQFSHEYCHLRTNYDGGSPQSKWFEEVICELCSIYALRRMSAVWAVNPPYSNWQSFSDSLSEYAEKSISFLQVLYFQLGFKVIYQSLRQILTCEKKIQLLLYNYYLCSSRIHRCGHL
jgi:hypothetical protein